MKVKREWMEDEDTLDLMDIITTALEESDAVDGDLDVVARQEESSYRDRGYIRVRYAGREFNLELWEELT